MVALGVLSAAASEFLPILADEVEILFHLLSILLELLLQLAHLDLLLRWTHLLDHTLLNALLHHALLLTFPLNSLYLALTATYDLFMIGQLGQQRLSLS